MIKPVGEELKSLINLILPLRIIAICKLFVRFLTFVHLHASTINWMETPLRKPMFFWILMNSYELRDAPIREHSKLFGRRLSGGIRFLMDIHPDVN